MRGLFQRMGDPAHGTAQQEEGERRVLGQAEHAFDHDGGEVDVGLAVDQAFAGDLSFFESSPGVRRGFCGRCGSTLTYEGDRWPGEVHLHVGAFDDPETLAPTGHAFADERVPWLKL